jgi:hypothetical protein
VATEFDSAEHDAKQRQRNVDRFGKNRNQGQDLQDAQDVEIFSGARCSIHPVHLVHPVDPLFVPMKNSGGPLAPSSARFLALALVAPARPPKHHTSCYLSIPTRGFTAAVSVFEGTPPKKPSV